MTKWKDAGPRTPKPGETVAVECWCRAEVVKVSIEDVAAGITGACGRASCHAPEING